MESVGVSHLAKKPTIAIVEDRSNIFNIIQLYIFRLETESDLKCE